jgi:acyl-CoA thioesterase
MDDMQRTAWTLEEARTYFAADRFATDQLGAIIEEVGLDEARVAFDVDASHSNASGGLMGGAIFTLADFAFAVASNSSGYRTVAVDVDIQFIAAAKGTHIMAESHADRIGRNLVFFSTTISDETGRLIAKAACTGYRTA